MASHSIPHMPPQEIPVSPERPLTYDEAWDRIEGLFGSAREAYAAVGGGETWLRSERAASGE